MQILKKYLTSFLNPVLFVTAVALQDEKLPL